jgi:hypothetical protein
MNKYIVSTFYMQSTFAMINAVKAIQGIMEDIWHKGYSVKDENGNFNELWDILTDRKEAESQYEGYNNITYYINKFKAVLRYLDAMCGEELGYFDGIIHENHKNLKKSWVGSGKEDNPILSEYIDEIAKSMEYWAGIKLGLASGLTWGRDLNIYDYPVWDIISEIDGVDYDDEDEDYDDEDCDDDEELTDEDCLQHFTHNGENLKDLYDNAINN